MVQFASYLRRVLHKTRLIFPRINGPIISSVQRSCITKIFIKTQTVETAIKLRKNPPKNPAQIIERRYKEHMQKIQNYCGL